MADQLEDLDQKSQLLQKAGDYVGALEAVEQALIIRKDEFGVDSEQVELTCNRLCELCNLLGMKYLEREDYGLALDLLKRAELLSEHNDTSRAVTLNNFSCYYRRVGKFRTALKFLERALLFEDESADTHLNLCAVLSQMGRHTEAAEHAMQAVILLQENTIEYLSNLGSEDRSSVLAIAFHNLAVEYEFLKRMPEALKFYHKAVVYARQHLPPDHKLIPSLESILATATQQSSTAKSREGRRRGRTESQSGLRSYIMTLHPRGKELRKSASSKAL
jgi:tetratricopeptide (TPR) repeat protein